MALKLEQKHVLTVTRTINTVGGVAAYFLVKEDTDPAKVVVAGANNDILGVLASTYAKDEDAMVVVDGIAIVSAGAAVTVGALLVSDANGEAIPKGSTADTHYGSFGRALTACSNPHELISFLFARQNYYVKA